MTLKINFKQNLKNNIVLKDKTMSEFKNYIKQTILSLGFSRKSDHTKHTNFIWPPSFSNEVQILYIFQT